VIPKLADWCRLLRLLRKAIAQPNQNVIALRNPEAATVGHY
jgi:hypothetical protein